MPSSSACGVAVGAQERHLVGAASPVLAGLRQDRVERPPVPGAGSPSGQASREKAVVGRIAVRLPARPARRAAGPGRRRSEGRSRGWRRAAGGAEHRVEHRAAAGSPRSPATARRSSRGPRAGRCRPRPALPRSPPGRCRAARRATARRSCSPSRRRRRPERGAAVSGGEARRRPRPRCPARTTRCRCCWSACPAAGGGTRPRLSRLVRDRASARSARFETAGSRHAQAEHDEPVQPARGSRR